MIYRVTVKAILLFCSETRVMGPADGKELESAQIRVLQRICGNKSRRPDSTKYAEILQLCQVPSIRNIFVYHRLTWLGKHFRMKTTGYLSEPCLMAILLGAVKLSVGVIMGVSDICYFVVIA